jgi:hypothetical protein
MHRFIKQVSVSSLSKQATIQKLTMEQTYFRYVSLFLGISMFMFGILKFVNPFKSWYRIQVTNSELGNTSYWLGIIGEIAVGLIFISIVMLMKSVSLPRLRLPGIFASAIVIVMMLTGMYVHFHPDVPAEVLPLKIKPPYIPGFFIALASLNSLLAQKSLR